ncbi:MAG: hypothetical protein NTZ74_09030 [Chloroflexi bacterium]|nr:hypothetical protein [Chloroflexota bacterium]
MEFDELEKRLVWLDSERQKDKKTIFELLDTVTLLKENNSKQVFQITLLESEVKKMRTEVSRAEKIDSDFSTYKTDVFKQINEIEKKITASESKSEKKRKEDAELFNKRMLEFQVQVKPIVDLKKGIQTHGEEFLRIGQKIEDVAKSITEFRSPLVELQRQQNAQIKDMDLENKRATDLQIESTVVRKRIEEQRNLIDLYREALQKVETRTEEILNLEKERKQNQIVFIEKVNLFQVEKENLWKEWQLRFSEMGELGSNLNIQILALEETHHSVRRSQADFEEINERFNRRINEITEMDRLSEERFRQEWVAFKSDDQKRWTNYNLSHDEEQRNEDRQITRILDRLVTLEDLSQELKDALQLVNEETQKQFKGFLALSQELLDSYNQSLGKRI